MLCDYLVRKVLFFILLIHQSTGHLLEIFKYQNEPIYGESIEPEKLFQFMSSGVPQIFWSFVNSSDFQNIQFIGLPCKESLLKVSRGFQNGDYISYKFLDSSAKTPNGFMRSTMGSFGDYDQCLSINDQINNLVGKYCAYDIFPTKSKQVTNDENRTFTFDQIPVFKGIPFIYSICLPSQCTKREVRDLLTIGNVVYSNI